MLMLIARLPLYRSPTPLFAFLTPSPSVRWLASKIFIGADRADPPPAHPLDGVTRSNVNSAKMQRIKTTESVVKYDDD